MTQDFHLALREIDPRRELGKTTRDDGWNDALAPRDSAHGTDELLAEHVLSR